MKFTITLLLLIVCSTALISQTAIAPAVGDGTEENPYQIENLENLYWIAADNDVVPNPDQESRWWSHYIQVDDIDALDTENWFGGEGWSPIGVNFDNSFSGSYDGQDHTIGGLYINRPDTNSIGLFGRADGAIIENIGLINVDISGHSYVGGLVGNQYYYSAINNSYSTGSVTGDWDVGGLVGGQSDSSISNSYSISNVTGYDQGVGGLVGIQGGSTISNSYSTGSVTGGVDIGGLVGFQGNSTISNSCSTGNVTGNEYVGGLVGSQLGSTISNSYSTGSVTGDEDAGGLVGRELGCTTIGSYWNTETSGQATSVGGEGRTTEEMTYPYADNTYVDWDFEEIWAADDDYTINNGYPFFQWQIMLIPPTNLYVDAQTGLFSWQEPEYLFGELLEYDIYLNGDYMATTEETECQYQNLINGENYTAGVVAVYDIGVSEMVTIDFIYDGTDTDKTEIAIISHLHNYPNPFNPETTISFSLQQEVENLGLKIYNTRGQLVRSLIAGTAYLPGEHQIIWNGRDERGRKVASGVYFCIMQTEADRFVRKVLMMK